MCQNGFFLEGKSADDFDAQISQKQEKIKEISNRFYLEEDLKFIQSKFLQTALVTFSSRQSNISPSRNLAKIQVPDTQI